MGNSTTDGTSVGTQSHLAPFGGGGSRSAGRRSVKVFLSFFAVYLFTWGGHYTSGAGAQKIAWAKVMLFGGFVLMRFGRPVLGMLLAASTITIRPDSVLLVALLALWRLFEQPTLGAAVKLGLAILPSLLIVAAANYARYHSAFDRGYAEEGFTTPLLLSLSRIPFSAGRNLFLFSPPLI